MESFPLCSDLYLVRYDKPMLVDLKNIMALNMFLMVLLFSNNLFVEFWPL
ncbi:hypothetical protein HOY80DRAFT_1142007 [Tuber brumale]|nr:hypothetical protein HOY80DRAFT_1142007 [Tuber brumale]